MRIAVIILLLLALQGCGRKGSLFMPPVQHNAQATTSQSNQ